MRKSKIGVGHEKEVIVNLNDKGTEKALSFYPTLARIAVLKKDKRGKTKRVTVHVGAFVRPNGALRVTLTLTNETKDVTRYVTPRPWLEVCPKCLSWACDCKKADDSSK